MGLHKWDLILVLAVSLQVLAVAYLYDPKWKALMLSLPMPFTFATMAVGEQVQAVNLLSMIHMFLFMQAVRVLYWRRVPILAAIVVSAVGYCLLGWMTAQLAPRGEPAFWVSAGLVFGLALLLYKRLRPREEPGDRTALPLWIKLPLTVLLVAALVKLKQELGGAITFFPMVGVFAAYEARKSLWTMGRQNTIVMMTMTPTVAAIHVLYPHLGLGASVFAAWGVFLSSFCLLKLLERRSRQALPAGGPGGERPAGL